MDMHLKQLHSAFTVYTDSLKDLDDDKLEAAIFLVLSLSLTF